MTSNEQQVIKGWDVYGHPYDYDETKIIAMLYRRLRDLGRYPDWEKICTVSHRIYDVYNCLQDNHYDGSFRKWMHIYDREEEAYIQAWFNRTMDNWIEYFWNSLKGGE